MQLHIPRHRTALARVTISRPVRLAVERAILRSDDRFFDFGCGRGTDVKHLQRRGVSALGWDPVTFPSQPLVSSDVVNLGFVLNVIENVEERREVLRQAWDISEGVLLVAARTEKDLRVDVNLTPYRDGYLTSLGTFQKFFAQSELRELIEDTVGVRGYALAPGIFAAFRSGEREQAFRDSLLGHAGRTLLHRKEYERLFAAHTELFADLMHFFGLRGRLPEPWELHTAGTIQEHFGSIRRAFEIIRHVVGTERWDSVREQAKTNIRIQLALDRFAGRSRFGKLPRAFQLDIKRLFGSYQAACSEADALLFSLGRFDEVREAARSSAVGKLMPSSWYVHADALFLAPPLLRLYEGCARSYIGEVDGANVIKLRLDEPRVSYLTYPGFDREPHPVLRASVSIGLRSFRYSQRQYALKDARKILHRKELLIAPDDERYPRFARLTKQEERAGLYESTDRIGDQGYWNELLANHGLRYRGHRLVRAREGQSG
jgi:DNA phosphorothioation-associated putative methyltransferase